MIASLQVWDQDMMTQDDFLGMVDLADVYAQFAATFDNPSAAKRFHVRKFKK
jgi:hypothetical protein